MIIVIKKNLFGYGAIWLEYSKRKNDDEVKEEQEARLNELETYSQELVINLEWKPLESSEQESFTLSCRMKGFLCLLCGVNSSGESRVKVDKLVGGCLIM